MPEEQAPKPTLADLTGAHANANAEATRLERTKETLVAQLATIEAQLAVVIQARDKAHEAIRGSL